MIEYTIQPACLYSIKKQEHIQPIDFYPSFTKLQTGHSVLDYYFLNFLLGEKVYFHTGYLLLINYCMHQLVMLMN